MNECLYTEEEAERLKRKSHGKIVGLDKKTYMASMQICAGENANKSGVSEAGQRSDDDNDKDDKGYCLSFHVSDRISKLDNNWVLMENHITVHIFANPVLLRDIQEADDPVNVCSTGGSTHCNFELVTEDFGAVYLHKGVLANILSYALVRDRYRITYCNKKYTVAVQTPVKLPHFQRSKWGLYYHNCAPGLGEVTLLPTVEVKAE